MIARVQDLDVYQRAKAAAMEVFHASKQFPPDEKYSLTDQIRRSSRSVVANLSEAWRKRRYPAAFAAKLNDAESEAAETQTWVEFAQECGYWNRDEAARLWREYDHLLAQLIIMIRDADRWCAGLA